MQFQVPQFIETESKIIGPLSIRQFSFLAGGLVVIVTCYYLLQTWLWILISLITGSISVTLAFLRMNGRPALLVLFNALSYFWNPRLYLWRVYTQQPSKSKTGGEKATRQEKTTRKSTPQLILGKLRNLELRLLTSERPPDERTAPATRERK